MKLTQTQRAPQENIGWPPEKIKAALPKGAQAEIARRAGCSKPHVWQVASRRSRSRTVEGLIAQFLRVPREEIFGPNRRPGPQRGPRAVAPESPSTEARV